jgi:hypothetical protein
MLGARVQNLVTTGFLHPRSKTYLNVQFIPHRKHTTPLLRLSAVQENNSCLNTQIFRWKKFKFRVLQNYGPAKVASMLTRVFKCQEGQHIGQVRVI